MPTPQPIPPDGGPGQQPPTNATATEPAPSPPHDDKPENFSTPGTEYALPDSPRPGSSTDNS
jgi:hypothetical protein